MRKQVGIVAVGLALALSHGASAQAPSAGTPQDYLFPSGAGALVFHVRPERATDFEAVVQKLSEVLDHSVDPIRHQQAASWRIFKSTEIQRDAAIYLFFFDPAVSGADYDPIKVLGESMPADVQGLYERLKGDVIRVERMGLAKLR
jgi:hypothetical protein